VVPALAGECPAGKVGDNAPSGTQTALPAHGNPGNGGKVTVVLTIADIVNDKKPATMEKMM
jgi:hypothetical protein